MGDRGTGRRVLDPILTRSLILAGAGLALLVLGRALARSWPPPGGQAFTVDNPPPAALWTLRDIPSLGVIFPSDS